MTAGSDALTLDDIVDLAKAYAAARIALDEVVQNIEAKRRKAVRSRIRALRSRVAETSAAREALEQAVKDHPQHFARPRTQSADGVKFGFAKKPGRVEIDDDEKTIRLIRKHLADDADTLLKTRETIDKTALRRLSTRDLARIGATLTESTDAITITVPRTDLDKIVDALMGDAGDEAEAAEAA